MYALKATLQPGSLYSMRLPYTHQSALTYPLPPPSTIKGLLANALQRAEDRPPEDCLAEVEKTIEGANASPTGPIATRSCIVVGIKRDPRSGKKTDALPRQFAHTLALDIYVLAKDEDVGFLRRCEAALRCAPIFLGDSESPASVTSVHVSPCDSRSAPADSPLETSAYVRHDLVRDIEGQNALFWCHETCQDARELYGYLFPCRLEGHTFWPNRVRGVLATQATRIEMDGTSLYFPEG